jgi:hypothetical protein
MISMFLFGAIVILVAMILLAAFKPELLKQWYAVILAIGAAIAAYVGGGGGLPT